MKLMVPEMLPVVVGSMGVPADVFVESEWLCSFGGDVFWLQPAKMLNKEIRRTNFCRWESFINHNICHSRLAQPGTAVPHRPLKRQIFGSTANQAPAAAPDMAAMTASANSVVEAVPPMSRVNFSLL